MAESGTIADIQVSVRQITQQSLVSRWYEIRARSSQSLLSSDWTLASKMVGRGGRKARRLSLTRTPARFPRFRRRRRLLAFATHTKGSDMVSVNSPPAFRNSKAVSQKHQNVLAKLELLNFIETAFVQASICYSSGLGNSPPWNVLHTFGFNFSGTVLKIQPYHWFFFWCPLLEAQTKHFCFHNETQYLHDMAAAAPTILQWE